MNSILAIIEKILGGDEVGFTPYTPTVLIVEDCNELRKEWVGRLNSIDATIICAASVADALKEIPKADILILDMSVDDNDGGHIFDSWMAGRRGPIAAMVATDTTEGQIDELYLRGANHVFRRSVYRGTLISVVRNYLVDVLQRRMIDQFGVQMLDLKKTVRSLRTTLVVLIFLLAALMGPTAIESLISIL